MTIKMELTGFRIIALFTSVVTTMLLTPRYSYGASVAESMRSLTSIYLLLTAEGLNPDRDLNSFM
jgi:hypothetical protein